MFSGYITALVTPFRDGRVDEDAFANLIERQIAAGISGLVPCGTTGESPVLSDAEQVHLITRCVEIVAGRVPVIAGTGSNNTAHAVYLTQQAQNAGADAALVVSPYYNKPSQDGLFHHFQTIHDQTKLPILLYNIPGRCGVDISIPTMKRLSMLPRIIGVKDATGDLARPLATRIALGNDFCQLSGEDATITAFLAQGGVGCISVTSNVAPELCVALYRAWKHDDRARMEQIRDQLLPLHEALFMEPNPAPAKYALSQLGLCQNELRQPLVAASPEATSQMRDVLAQLGLADEQGRLSA